MSIDLDKELAKLQSIQTAKRKKKQPGLPVAQKPKPAGATAAFDLYAELGLTAQQIVRQQVRVAPPSRPVPQKKAIGIDLEAEIEALPSHVRVQKPKPSRRKSAAKPPQKGSERSELPIRSPPQSLGQFPPLSIAEQSMRRAARELHEENPKPGQAPKVPVLFEHGGKTWVSFGGGGPFGPNRVDRRVALYEVVPKSEWKRPTFTKEDLYRRWSQEQGARGSDYTGLELSVKGEFHVVTGRVAFTTAPRLSWDAQYGHKLQKDRQGRYWWLVDMVPIPRKGDPRYRLFFFKTEPDRMWAVPADVPHPEDAEPVQIPIEGLEPVVSEWIDHFHPFPQQKRATMDFLETLNWKYHDHEPVFPKGTPTSVRRFYEPWQEIGSYGAGRDGSSFGKKVQKATIEKLIAKGLLPGRQE